MKKNRLGLVAVILGCGISIQAEAAKLSTITDILNQPRPVVDHKSVEKSGYKTTSQVVDQKELFTRSIIKVSDLEPFMPELWQAMALDQFTQAITNRLLSPQGIVMEVPFKVGNQVFAPGHIVSVADLIRANKDAVTSTDLYRDLQTSAILNSSGLLAGLPAAVTYSTFSEVDFSFLSDGLSKLDFPIQNATLKAELQRDLGRLLAARHKVIEVTQEETTRYQSRQTGLFENIWDQAVGGFAGAVFFPDKLKTVQTSASWLPTVDVPQFYRFNKGFNERPYAFGGKGNVIVNGLDSQTQLCVTKLDNDGLTFIDGTCRFLWSHTTELDSPLLATGFQIQYQQLTDDSAQAIRLGSVDCVGSIEEADFYTRGIAGLTLKKDYQSDWALGLNVGGEFGWNLPVVPATLFGALISHNQPNMLEKLTMWDWNVLQGGINVHLPWCSLTGGYEWVTTNKTTVMRGWFWGLRSFL